MKELLLISLLLFSSSTLAEWVEYSIKSNGDVVFFDKARVEKNGALVKIWTRVRFKTSLMGASSYQSLLQINCASRSETTLQNTFFSDKNWTSLAMATNTRAKPEKKIKVDSVTAQLADMLCNE